MKMVTIVLGAALLTAAPFAAALAEGAYAKPSVDKIVFAYDLDRNLLASEAGAQRVYWDLERKARRVCQIPGSFGVASIDGNCAAELTRKVVAASGSVALERRFAASRFADAETSDSFAIVLR